MCPAITLDAQKSIKLRVNNMTIQRFNKIYLKMSPENKKLWSDIAVKTSVWNPDRDYWLAYYRPQLIKLNLNLIS